MEFSDTLLSNLTEVKDEMTFEEEFIDEKIFKMERTDEVEPEPGRSSLKVVKHFEIAKNEVDIGEEFSSEIKFEIKEEKLFEESIFVTENVEPIEIKTSYVDNLDMKVEDIKVSPKNEFAPCEDKLDEKNKSKKELCGFLCSECGYRVPQKRKLEAHINAVHSKLKFFCCSLCEFKTSHKGSLKCHIYSIHFKLRPFKCSFCKYEASEKVQLRLHIGKVHRVLELLRYSCSYCDYKTNIKCNLLLHIKAVHMIKTVHLFPNSIKCSRCNFETRSERDLKRHMDKIHLKLNFLQCSKCDYNTVDQKTFRKHVHGSHLKFDKFQCSKCNFKTGYLWSLNKHNKI